MEPLEFKMARALIENLKGRKGFEDWWLAIGEEDQEDIIRDQAQYIREAMK